VRNRAASGIAPDSPLSRRRVQVGLLTGIYSTTLIRFAALAAGISVPVADAFGGGWRPGLAI
jgi:cyanate permease